MSRFQFADEYRPDNEVDKAASLTAETTAVIGKSEPAANEPHLCDVMPVTDLLFWQAVWRRDLTHAAILLGLRAREDMSEAEQLALWEGHYAVDTEARHCMKCAVYAGLLLTMFEADKPATMEKS